MSKPTHMTVSQWRAILATCPADLGLAFLLTEESWVERKKN